MFIDPFIFFFFGHVSKHFKHIFHIIITISIISKFGTIVLIEISTQTSNLKKIIIIKQFFIVYA
jgi:hypothetical protein